MGCRSHGAMSVGTLSAARSTNTDSSTSGQRRSKGERRTSCNKSSGGSGREAKRVFKNNKLRNKDLMEWSYGEIEAREGEALAYLPGARVWVAVRKDLDKRPGQG